MYRLGLNPGAGSMHANLLSHIFQDSFSHVCTCAFLTQWKCNHVDGHRATVADAISKR